MIEEFAGRTAVLTGAGSGFGLECARIAAQRGMRLVLVDVQQDALDKAAAELREAGAEVLARLLAGLTSDDGVALDNPAALAALKAVILSRT